MIYRIFLKTDYLSLITSTSNPDNPVDPAYNKRSNSGFGLPPSLFELRRTSGLGLKDYHLFRPLPLSPTLPL